MSSENNTEKIILQAARKIFVRKGFDGARMQEIADEAGINKSLLHYYFRSKEKLFEAIFTVVFKQIQSNLLGLVQSDKPLLEKLESFIDNYLDILSVNPYLPAFVSHEINRNPEKIITSVQSIGIKPNLLNQQIMDEIEKGTIWPIIPQHLIINILALCAFPFIARPMLDKLVFGNNEESIDAFNKGRKEEVKTMILRSLKRQP